MKKPYSFSALALAVGAVLASPVFAQEAANQAEQTKQEKEKYEPVSYTHLTLPTNREV